MYAVRIRGLDQKGMCDVTAKSSYLFSGSWDVSVGYVARIDEKQREGREFENLELEELNLKSPLTL